MVVSEKEVSRWLDSWRELALIIRSVFLWQQPSYPFAILGGITLLFIELAYLEPRVVSVLCGIGLLSVLLDYAVPRLSSKLYNEQEWTTTKQSQLDLMAKEISASMVFICALWTGLQSTKHSSPSTYYLLVVPTLFILGWIGAHVNNLFITYLAVVWFAMLPGLYSRGLLEKYYRITLEYTVQAMRSLSNKKTK